MIQQTSDDKRWSRAMNLISGDNRSSGNKVDPLAVRQWFFGRIISDLLY